MRALILGVLGQDGSYLAEQLVADGYDVWGMVRRPAATAPVPTVVGDLLDQVSLERALTAVKPDEVFNLAAITSPGGGWGTPQPPLLADVTGVGVIRLLDAMLKCAPEARLVHASSSAVFDLPRYGVYGAAKMLAHEAVVGYRKKLHCSNAVLFSHTSPRQDRRFLARRITTAAARIASGSDEKLILGDVDSRRDWGYAPDYCDALRIMARQDTPHDRVIATGKVHSVRDLAEAALSAAGLSWNVVAIDPNLPKVPDEVAPPEDRIASAKGLGWSPKTGFAEMVDLMVKEALDGIG